MFVHAVYFWMNPGLTADQHAEFVRRLRGMAAIPHVTHGHVGTPASTDRPVIERSYSYALVLTFADKAAHDAYQEHPVHDAFRNECATLWQRIVIHDSVDVG